jgi:hypothetical protein
MGVRRFATVLGTAVGGLGLVVALAGPAGAKGATGLTIGYPGGGPPMDLGGDGTTSQMGPLTEDLGLWSAFGDTQVVPLTAEPPSAPVGAPYTVRWTMYDGAPADGMPVITQRLYLDPDGGGLVYTEAGQDAGPYAEDGTRGGWFQAPANLQATLAAAGFDPTAPPASPAAAAAADETAPRDQANGRGWLAAVGLAAAAAVGATAVGAAGVAVRRGRRQRDAAPAAG